MALIRILTQKTVPERVSLHDEIEAQYFVHEKDGRSILQIDSYGRDERQVPGKVSQTLQFDREGAESLYKILKSAFHFT
ncbi:MAG: methionyl-tRNA formyltransferase [Pseudomonadota bacterium]